MNVFYSNRTVQNVIELKNKYATHNNYSYMTLLTASLLHCRRSTWLTARSCSLTAAQGEVKVGISYFNIFFFCVCQSDSVCTLFSD